MAYSTSNPPKLLAQGTTKDLGAWQGPGSRVDDTRDEIGSGNVWLYIDTDPVLTVAGTNYFTNGFQLGMRVGDTILFSDTNLGQFYSLYCSASSVEGSVTVDGEAGSVVIAATGSSASDAAVLTGLVNPVTGADGAKGVALLAADGECSVLVVNTVLDQPLPVYPVSGGDDSINGQAEDIPFWLAPGKSAWFTSTSTTLWYVDPSAGEVPLSVGMAAFEWEDDFIYAAIDVTDKWTAVAGATATIAAIDASSEGRLKQICGTDGGAGVTDCAAISSRLITDGALVSLGMIVFEARIAQSHVTGATVCVGLSDKVVSGSAEAVLHTVKTEAIADDGLTVGDALSFCQDSEATTPLMWYATSENNGTIAYNATAVNCKLDVGPTAAAYQVLRIEVDANGDARWYVDGVLKFTETTAVKTAAVLVPYIAITAEDGTPVATSQYIDKVKFSGQRNPVVA